MQSPDPTLVAPPRPPLPQLHGDLMLDVFTHHSITQGILNDQTPHGNSERLAQLGQSVLDTIVTCVLFDERPMLSGEELKMRHAHILSDQSIIYWINSYDSELKKRVKVASRDILDDPKEARFLFNSYVGAVSVQDGLPAAASWISKLLKPDDPPPALMDGSGSRPTSTSPPLVRIQAQTSGTSSIVTAPPPYYPNAPQVAASPTPPPAVPLGTLAIFNQTCSQLRFALEWNSSSNGPQHDPRWEVKCMVNGVERGSGLGRNQKQAKEMAAYQAYQYMQSIGWTLQEPEPTTA